MWKVKFLLLDDYRRKGRCGRASRGGPKVEKIVASRFQLFHDDVGRGHGDAGGGALDFRHGSVVLSGPVEA
jgi:hypothetical protein